MHECNMRICSWPLDITCPLEYITFMKTFHPIEFPEIEATENNGARYYTTPTGIKYPSVTTVLSAHSKKGIIEWRKRVGKEEANKISRQAAARGSRIHSMCEHYLKGTLYEGTPTIIDQENFKYFTPLLDKIDDIYAIEAGLFSHHLRMAGRVDCVAKYEGTLSIIDFKTSSREKQESHIQNYFMQASAYAIMFEELTGKAVANTVILISVDGDSPQVFKKKRDDYVAPLIKYRDLFELNNTVG